MFIQTESTPNPATLKFLPGRTVLDAGTADFPSAEAAAKSPLAARIFASGGVTGVFFGNDFVTVTKAGDVDWAHIKPAILGAIMEHFQSGQPVIEGEGGTRSIPQVSAFMPFVDAGIPFIVSALALLMVSNAPYAAFKGDMVKPNSIKGILLITAVLSLIVGYPHDALFVFFSIYALSGVIGGLYNAVRRKPAAKEA